jgi:hypothetical protein
MSYALTILWHQLAVGRFGGDLVVPGGVAGASLAVPGVFGLAVVADRLTISVLLPGWLLAATAGLTVVMALRSSLSALRLLRGPTRRSCCGEATGDGHRPGLAGRGRLRCPKGQVLIGG